MVSTTPQVVFGPLQLRVTQPNGEPGDAPRTFGGVRKLVARWELAVNGDTILSNAPFYYGSSCEPHAANAGDILQSFLSDLQSIEPYAGAGDDVLDEWAQWADDLGYFAGDSRATDIRDSINAYREMRARRELIVERLEDGSDELAAILEVARECEDDCPIVNGAELHDAGHVGIDTARAESCGFHGRRWEDDAGNVYSAADVLAARLEV